MKRTLSLSKIRFFSATLMVATMSVVLLGQNVARADEFALIPAGDPIYSQLSALSSTPSKSAAAKPGSLTRYEAALQAARAILDAQNRDGSLTTRADWRSIKGLCVSLKAELRQLGVDVEAASVMADANLKAAVLSSPAPTTLRGSGSPLSVKGTARSSVLMTDPGLDIPNVQTTAIGLSLSQKLRAGAALQALQRADSDPFNHLGQLAVRGENINDSQKSLATGIASQTSLAYDFNRWLTLRAATSDSHLVSNGNTSPLLSAPFFAGASKASSAGGGVDVSLGSNLKFSTDFENLRTDTGNNASRIGGGASLSAWQNRLSLSAYLSRLIPEDQAALPATAAELNVGLDVTRRLSLNLLYQGLFAESKNNNAGRVSGGLSLNF